jgi:hypothetical protein
MILVITALAIGLAGWSHWLIQRNRASRSRYAWVAALGLVVAGLPWITAAKLQRAFSRAGDVSPAESQAVLSHSISSAMIWSLVAFGIAAVWMIALVVLTVRGPGTPES